MVLTSSLGNNSKFTSVAAWCSGDFDANGSVDGADFIIWNNNKFQSSDAIALRSGTTPQVDVQRDEQRVALPEAVAATSSDTVALTRYEAEQHTTSLRDRQDTVEMTAVDSVFSGLGELS